MKFCRHCGKEVKEEAFLCMNCGCQTNHCGTGVHVKHAECMRPNEVKAPVIDAQQLVAYIFIALSLALVTMSLSTLIGASLVLISKVFYIIFQICSSLFAIIGLVFAILIKKDKAIALASAALLPSLFLLILIFI